LRARFGSLEEERTWLCGRRDRHDPERHALRAGSPLSSHESDGLFAGALEVNVLRTAERVVVNAEATGNHSYVRRIEE
jgi:hypothetical protein